MKPIKRNMLALSLVLLIGGFLLAVICIFTDNYTSPLGYASLVALLAGLVMNHIFARCPHCRRYVKGVSPFSEETGVCPKCGEKLEFDRP